MIGGLFVRGREDLGGKRQAWSFDAGTDTTIKLLVLNLKTIDSRYTIIFDQTRCFTYFKMMLVYSKYERCLR